MGPSNLVRTLAPQMVHEAQKYMAPRVQASDAFADLWLAEKSDERAVRDELTAAYAQAIPSMNLKHEPPELAVAVFPSAGNDDVLQHELQRALPQVEIATIDSGNEIVFYREWHRLNLSDLDCFGPAAQELYQKRCAADPASLHSREDVSAWQTLAAVE